MRLYLSAILLLSFAINSSAFLESLFGHSSSKNQCPIKLYDPKDPSFTGIKIYANAETFQPLLRILSTYAKDCRVKIRVKQAFIQENLNLAKLKLNDRTDMSFRLGEAIEFELLDRENKLLCNTFCLQKDLTKLSSLPDAKCFLQKLAKDSRFRQDAIKPNILTRRPTVQESLTKLQEQRVDIQTKCKELKLDV